MCDCELLASTKTRDLGHVKAGRLVALIEVQLSDFRRQSDMLSSDR